jgi:CMP-2-keto-3-deoxyoctulosonic acid synthetase
MRFSDDTIIVNIQGDEPMIPPAIVRQVAENLAASLRYGNARGSDPRCGRSV